LEVFLIGGVAKGESLEGANDILRLSINSDIKPCPSLDEIPVLKLTCRLSGLTTEHRANWDVAPNLPILTGVLLVGDLST
jgi:hypothetical protein